MDPLSIAASVITVIGAIGGVSETIKRLLSLRGASDALLALNNEVCDLQLVLQAIETLLQKNSCSIQHEIALSIQNSSDQAGQLLRDLDTVINFSKMSTKGLHSTFTFNRAAWCRQHSKIQRIQGNLRSLRIRLVTALGVLTSSSSLRLEVELQHVQLIAKGIQSQQHTILTESSRADDRNQRAIQGTLSQMMESYATTQDQIAQLQFGLPLGSNENHRGAISPIMVPQPSITATRTVSHSVKFSTYYQESSTFDCRCSCHRPRRLRSPQFLDVLLGSFFLGYVSLPVISPKCEMFECNHPPSPTIWVDYYFPSWFLDWKVHFLMRNRHGYGPEQLLRVSRVIEPTSKMIKAAMQGDVQSIRSLLRDGHGSPYDTDGTNTPLIVRNIVRFRFELADQCLLSQLAVQCEHVEICEVLLHAGADPYEETSLQRSAYDYAWDMLLGNLVDERNIEGLQRLFSDTSALENRQFTLLHKVVLGLNPVDLSTIVQNMSLSRINEGDAYGQTALCWAVMRQDVESTKLLLQRGANPNITPEKGHTALQSAARSGSYMCIELLLHAGAEVDYQGAAQMTALHIAVVEHDDVSVVGLLLQHGADINLKAQLGSSALFFACIHGHLHTTKYLVEHGADVHQLYPSGEGVLHVACWGNNPEIVRFLLKSVNYCPTTRTFGTILHIAARFLSMEVMKVLTEARIEGIDTEERFEGYTALEYAEQRKNVPSEWSEAFADLLRSVNRNIDVAQTQPSPEGGQSNSGIEKAEKAGKSSTISGG